MTIIGISGGSGSGKTTVVKKIMNMFNDSKVNLLSQDNYYKDNSHLSEDERKAFNYDHPNAIEFSLICEHIDKLKNNQSIVQPSYSYTTGARGEGVEMSPCDVLVIEGILVLVDENLRDRLDVKIFVDAPADERLIRVIRRDTIERGRNTEEVLERYLRVVKPMHEHFIESSKKYADIIVPQGGHNEVAIHMISEMIKNKINE